MLKHEWPDAVIVAYSPSSAAVATGLKLHRIQSAIRDGSLRAVRVGTKTRITRASIEAWLDAMPPANRATAGVPHVQS
jgi:excisionase family DNA binding protein